MFLMEKELKELFWKFYNSKGRAIKYQFECDIREGCADLVTVEKYQQNYQLNAFEFKLSDIKKALLQAEENLKYVHKSMAFEGSNYKKSVTAIDKEFTNIIKDCQLDSLINQSIHQLDIKFIEQKIGELIAKKKVDLMQSFLLRAEKKISLLNYIDEGKETKWR